MKIENRRHANHINPIAAEVSQLESREMLSGATISINQSGAAVINGTSGKDVVTATPSYLRVSSVENGKTSNVIVSTQPGQVKSLTVNLGQGDYLNAQGIEGAINVRLSTGNQADPNQQISISDTGVLRAQGGKYRDYLSLGSDNSTVRFITNQDNVDGTRTDVFIGKRATRLSQIIANFGDGDDTLLAHQSNVPVNASMGNGNDIAYGGSRNDRLVGGNGDDRLHGFAGNDFLSGEAGRDQLVGGDGDDTLHGGIGADYLAGSKGADTIHGGNDNIAPYYDIDTVYSGGAKGFGGSDTFQGLHFGVDKFLRDASDVGTQPSVITPQISIDSKTGLVNVQGNRVEVTEVKYPGFADRTFLKISVDNGAKTAEIQVNGSLQIGVKGGENGGNLVMSTALKNLLRGRGQLEIWAI